MISPLHIRLAMAAFNMSQIDLAAKMGVDKMTIGRYLRGDKGIAVGLVAEMERYFKERGVCFVDEGDQAPAGGLGIRLPTGYVSPA